MSLPLCLILSIAPLTAQAQPARRQQVDLLIRGGTLIDGSGSPQHKADVGVTANRVSFVGDAAASSISATREIDATGLIVSPGFIDPHTHALQDLSDPERRANLNYLMQGVTTVIVGNDGGGPFEVESTIKKWNSTGIGTNAAVLAGYATIREEIMGKSGAKPTARQMNAMKRLVKRAMDGGAIGFSTGLFYAPQNFGTTEEVIELARIAAKSGGFYDSHLRDESSYTIGLKGAIEEALRIGREAKIAVHIAHIKALGVDVWGQSGEVIEMINKARAAGQDVTADQYPYTASGSALGSSLLPRWVQEGGETQMVARFDDPSLRGKLRAEMSENLRRRGGAESLLLLTPKDRSLAGKTLAQIAKERQKDPIETAIEILRSGECGVASFNMRDDDLERFMQQDWVVTGSDGSSGHPRKYGTFPRKIRRYVIERKILSLEQAIHRSSGLTAQMMRLKDRGLVKEGLAADIIAFDLSSIRDAATYERPRELSEGVRWVVVNGQVAVAGGKPTGVSAGKALARD